MQKKSSFKSKYFHEIKLMHLGIQKNGMIRTGGFDPEAKEILFLKNNLTYHTALHEGFHAEQFLELGKQAYSNLGPLAREEHVYKMLIQSGKLTSIEYNVAEEVIEHYRDILN